VVAFCIVVTLVALVVRYPDAFRAANEAARANARLDNLDRYLGGGNSVLPDQSIALEAKGWIPPDGTFTVVVGPPRPGWPPLATQASVDSQTQLKLLLYAACTPLRAAG